MRSAVITNEEFEKRGASGCSNSHYVFVITTCCAHVGVEDSELQTYYWDPADLGRRVRVYETSPCPTCGASVWNYVPTPIEEPAPASWLWAVRDVARETLQTALQDAVAPAGPLERPSMLPPLDDYRLPDDESSWSIVFQKDPSVTDALDLLRTKFGDALVVEDRWDADLRAIGLTIHGNPGLLVYFCTFERKPGRYYVDLEFPGPPGSTLPHVQGEAFDDVDFDTLAAIVSQHLHLEPLSR